ncbi:MAG: hypothetical protein NW224_06195 [Leptolyngbyaceae cyanobacterium bins.302]|nr:hypothetical protein [Leptolyngbyaceae cyanobacterium bins.302]
MTNANPRDQRSADPSDRFDLDAHRSTPTYPAPFDSAQSRSGYGNGFLTGFLSSSVLWLLLGTALWFTQLRHTPQPTTIAPASPTTQAPQSAPSEAVEPGTTNLDSTQSNTSGSETAPAQPQVGQAPALTGLNLQRNHPNGSTLRVEQVKFSPDSIAIAMTVTNGADFDITLNSFGKGMYLQDDQGNSYNLSAPQTNPDVKVPAKTTARGEFVFLGSIPSNVTKLTLVTNLRNGGSDTNQYSRMPTFQVGDIPVKR